MTDTKIAITLATLGWDIKSVDCEVMQNFNTVLKITAKETLSLLKESQKMFVSEESLIERCSKRFEENPSIRHIDAQEVLKAMHTLGFLYKENKFSSMVSILKDSYEYSLFFPT